MSEKEPCETGKNPCCQRKNRSVSIDKNSVDIKELLCDRRELTIIHGEELYKLRLTVNNKLILTK